MKTITVPEIAAMFGISEPSVYRWKDVGILPAPVSPPGQKPLLWDRAAVEKDRESILLRAKGKARREPDEGLTNQVAAIASAFVKEVAMMGDQVGKLTDEVGRHTAFLETASDHSKRHSAQLVEQGKAIVKLKQSDGRQDQQLVALVATTTKAVETLSGRIDELHEKIGWLIGWCNAADAFLKNMMKAANVTGPEIDALRGSAERLQKLQTN